MKELGKRWNRELEIHKKTIAHLGKEASKKEKLPENILTAAIKQGESLSLHYADYKCQKCSSPEVTLHHLVFRNTKDYMDFGRYVASRHYWNNIIVLCPTHHAEIEGNGKGIIPKMGTISSDKIKNIKRFFVDKDDRDK